MKLYRKWTISYLVFLAAALFFLLALVEPSLIRARQAGELSPGMCRRLIRVTRLVFLLLNLLWLAFLSHLYVVFFRPLKRMANYSSLCLSGITGQAPPMEKTAEFATLQVNLQTMAENVSRTDNEQQIFLSNLSHDFRSPLTTIKGFTEAILDGTIEPHEQEKYLNIILNMTQRLTDLSTALVTLNQATGHENTLHLTDFDVNELIFSTASAMELDCRKRDIRLSLKLSSHLPLVCADEAKIRQVIIPLLDNAIKFSDPHRDLIIRSYYRPRKIFVSIRDFGAVIPTEEIPHLWTRFYKSDSSRDKDMEGNGIGLTIVRQYLSLHNQEITVSSSKENGTEFCFTLDRAQSGAAQKRVYRA